MPKPNDDIPQPEPPPVRPPNSASRFPRHPTKPEFRIAAASQPCCDPRSVAGVAPAPAEPETLRRENGRLRDKINEALEKHPELRDATNEIALTQGLHVEVGTPFLERVRAKLQERARAIIEQRPDLERLFDD